MRALACFVTLTLLSTHALAEPSATPTHNAEADKLAIRGNAAWESGDYLAALDYFERAYALFHSPNLRYNMGRVLSDLGRDLDALIAFEEFLAKAPDAPEQARKIAAAKVAVLAQRVGYISIRTPVAETQVTLDGLVYDKAALEKPIRVTAGLHQLAGQAPGYLPFIASVPVQAGETKITDVKLVKTVASKPVYKKAWFWGVIAGAAVVAVGGTLAGVYAQPHNPSPSWGTFTLAQPK